MYLVTKKAKKSRGKRMRKKSRQLIRFFVSIICLISILGGMRLVSAEDRVEVLPPATILKLSGTPQLSIESVLNNAKKFLRISRDDGTTASEMQAPFDTRLIFPVFNKLSSDNQKGVLPSTFILNNLTLDFDYTVWTFDEAPGLRLPENPNYELHVGDAIGAPTMVRWGVRKTGKGPYESFALEHVVDYLNRKGNWVRVYTRSMRWSPAEIINEEYREYWWGGNTTEYYDDIYWKEIQNPKTKHVSPLINGVAPEPAENDIGNNVGTIEGVHVERGGQVGSTPDLLAEIEVRGAVKGEVLQVSDEDVIPDKHFKIEHDMKGIEHLLTDDIYTAIGRGEVSSTVTDYEDDATIFTQEVTVSTTEKTGINVYLAGTDIVYDSEWMSNDLSADDQRRGGLDIQADSWIYGNYDLLTKVKNDKVGFTNVTREYTDEKVTTADKISEWRNRNEDSAKNGDSVTSIACLTDDHDTPLSTESDAIKIFYDSTLPTITNVRFKDEEWKEFDSHDAQDFLSGLEDGSGGVYYRFISVEEAGEIKPPINSDWLNIEGYQLIGEPGKYNLYVYAKDNATNRSGVLKVNEDPIIVPEKLPAKVRLEKKVVDAPENNQDIFILHMKEENNLLGSVALRAEEQSAWMTLDMEGKESRTIEVWEVVPMDYSKEYRIYVSYGEDNNILLKEGENKITVQAGDEITVTIENTFCHAGYFKNKDVVTNAFWRKL